jgi:hypothetical protein
MVVLFSTWQNDLSRTSVGRARVGQDWFSPCLRFYQLDDEARRVSNPMTAREVDQPGLCFPVPSETRNYILT